mgnify:CR=1 FL=1
MKDKLSDNETTLNETKEKYETLLVTMQNKDKEIWNLNEERGWMRAKI